MVSITLVGWRDPGLFGRALCRLGAVVRPEAWAWITLLPFVIGVSACSALLPDGRSAQGQGWVSFENARDDFQTLIPYVSTRDQVHAKGLDPFMNPSVALLTYSDLVQRLGSGMMLPQAENLDRGLRECLQSGTRCTGYQVSRREVSQRRLGNFWLDLLNFRRETESRGWSFLGLIVFVDDQVVLTLHGGQPRLYEFNVQRNPLGPLQGMAERAVQGAVQP